MEERSNGVKRVSDGFSVCSFKPRGDGIIRDCGDYTEVIPKGVFTKKDGYVVASGGIPKCGNGTSTLSFRFPNVGFRFPNKENIPQDHAELKKVIIEVLKEGGIEYVSNYLQAKRNATLSILQPSSPPASPPREYTSPPIPTY